MKKEIEKLIIEWEKTFKECKEHTDLLDSKDMFNSEYFEGKGMQETILIIIKDLKELLKTGEQE